MWEVARTVGVGHAGLVKGTGTFQIAPESERLDNT